MNKFIDLVRLLRPKFYNGITWTIVVSGLAMMSTPFWAGLLDAWLKKKFGFGFIDEFNPLYGLALVVVALLYNSLNLYWDRITAESGTSASSQEEAEKLKRERDHDVGLYEREAAVLGQNEVDYFYNYVGANHCYIGDHGRCLAEFHDFSILTENRYFNESVLSKRDDLAKVCRKLSGFISKHFFVFPNYKIGDDFQYTMYPDLNIDRGGSGDPVHMARYDKYADELLELLKELRSSYATYRLSIKKAFTI
mgnify:CR=1 FL=1